MSGIRRAPGPVSDDWLLEQQTRAELEAEAWRRLRESLALPPPEPSPAPPSPGFSAPATATALGRGGSIILKAIVRFCLAAFGAYLAWIAGIDSGMGEFEVWLATGAGFLVALSLSMLEPARRFVHLCAEALRWGLIVGAAFGGLWLAMNASSWT